MDQPRSKASEETTDLELQNREEIDFYRSGIRIWILDRLSPSLCASGQFFFSVLSYSFLISPCSTYFSVFIYFFLRCIYLFFLHCYHAPGTFALPVWLVYFIVH